MRNIGALLRAAGVGFEHVVRTTVFLADMNDFARDERGLRPMFVGDPPPARATVQVARLPRDVKVEIDVIAVSRNSRFKMQDADVECAFCILHFAYRLTLAPLCPLPTRPARP